MGPTVGRFTRTAVARRGIVPAALARCGAVIGAATVALLLLGIVAAGPAGAHDERETVFPDGTGSVPAYRTDGPRLLVCKNDRADFATRIAGFDTALRQRNLALFDECQRGGYRHLQEAVDNVRQPGTNILVLPGLYQEEPSLSPASAVCADLDAPMASNDRYRVLTFAQQRGCPNEQNLVAVLGVEDLQIEGTGAGPADVVIDAQYRKLNAIRADRADGFYLRNLTAQRTTFNAVYVMETDGFVIDTVVGRWNDEYGFLVFANDHGLLTNCEGYGNGDSAVYPGASSDINAGAGHDVERYAVEISYCYGHHNLLGYSGTAGNSVWAHDNVFTQNATGVATDSAFPNHPGMPQNHARFERNIIGDNNEDYYRYVRDGTCLKPFAERGYEDGVVCPAVGLPVGTGVLNPGGNHNIWRDNWIYGHSYAGFLTSWVPGFVRGEGELAAQFDTSHHNRYLDNRMGVTPEGEARPNRMDVWWDGQGRGSCWQGPLPAGAEPLALPACGADELPAGAAVSRYVAEPGKTLKMYVCAEYSQAEQRLPAGCDWYGAAGLGRIEVQLALAEAVLLGVLLLGLWARRLRRALAALPSALVAVAGLAVGVVGTGYEASGWTPVGLAVFGAGAVWFGLHLRRGVHPGAAGGGGPGREPAPGRRSAGLGWLTVAVGVFALLGAVDRGLTMIPLIPVPPSLVRIVLEFGWVPWAVVAVLRRRAPAATGTARVPEPRPDPEPVGEPSAT
jgi:hypothetical protein